MSRNAISLFSSSGIGDLGLKANGIKTIIACELLKERMDLFSSNYPEAKCFQGDIFELKDEIINYYKTQYNDNPFLILATPPCQGMSSNGMGKILNDYRKGLRPKMDKRNRLIIPAIEIIKELQPEWVILENVSNMENTYIFDRNDNLINIIDFIKRELFDIYIGEPLVIDAADYGIPQHRKRLVTVLTKNKKGREFFNSGKKLIPDATHSEFDTLITKHWVTLREAIGNLSPLRAEIGKNIDTNVNLLHRVPLLDEKKIFWIDNTPEGESAFNNQCINPLCGFSGNKRHGAAHNEEGINKYNTETPLYCEKCGSLLPRPYVEDKKTGKKRIMKGYVSAYKRMLWNAPASTLTQNFQFACSDNKIHPEQCRVLSLYEGLILQSISEYDYSFIINKKLVSDGLIRDTIGESVPPKIIDLIIKHIFKIMK